MKAAWMAGDFGQIAPYIAGEAENFVRGSTQPGTQCLDVACGTGNSAIPAARAGAQVTGVDIATNFSSRPESAPPRSSSIFDSKKAMPRNCRIRIDRSTSS